MSAAIEERLETARRRFEAAIGSEWSINRDAQDAVRIEFGQVPASVQVLPLGDELLVYSLTQVIAWDLPATEEVLADIGAARDRIQFGTLRALEREVTVDVILAYAFPVAELPPAALGEFVNLLLAQGFEARTRLVG